MHVRCVWIDNMVLQGDVSTFGQDQMSQLSAKRHPKSTNGEVLISPSNWKHLPDGLKLHWGAIPWQIMTAVSNSCLEHEKLDM